mgnify:CR=1 FL=1
MAQKKLYFQFKPEDRLLLEKYAETIPEINHDDSIDLKAKKILLIAINAKKPEKKSMKNMIPMETDFLDSIL